MLHAMSAQTPATRGSNPVKWGLLALAASLMASACAANRNADDMKIQTPRQAAAEFLPQVDAALEGLGIARESLQVRANRCEGAQGESRDDLYYIWAGLRGNAGTGEAGALIDAAHVRWQAAGWDIGRYRELDNGGRNLTATDPATGNTYTLDAGFRGAPVSALAGFFNTPCMRSPEGAVAFGELAPGP